MSYLLQNRRRYYETILPRIPDLKVRGMLEEIVHSTEPQNSPETAVDKSSIHLSSIDLEDAFKKPGLGERLGRVVISVEELLDRAIQLELLCQTAFVGLTSEPTKQILDSSSVRIGKLRKLRDSLQYHRFRLLD